MTEIARLFSEGGIWMWAILGAGILHAIPIVAQLVMARKVDITAYLWGGLAVILMLGAAGTVIGCIQGFGALEAIDPAQRTAMTMRMLGIALIPTAFAMIVAIPGVAATGVAASLRRNLSRAVSQPA
jgi:biopolymer transport protein ExbB/TolQ